jgi:hypothetical protein
MTVAAVGPLSDSATGNLLARRLEVAALTTGRTRDRGYGPTGVTRRA